MIPVFNFTKELHQLEHSTDIKTVDVLRETPCNLGRRTSTKASPLRLGADGNVSPRTPAALGAQSFSEGTPFRCEGNSPFFTPKASQKSTLFGMIPSSGGRQKQKPESNAREDTTPPLKSAGMAFSGKKNPNQPAQGKLNTEMTKSHPHQNRAFNGHATFLRPQAIPYSFPKTARARQGEPVAEQGKQCSRAGVRTLRPSGWTSVPSLPTCSLVSGLGSGVNQVVPTAQRSGRRQIRNGTKRAGFR